MNNNNHKDHKAHKVFCIVSLKLVSIFSLRSLCPWASLAFGRVSILGSFVSHEGLEKGEK